MIFLGFKWYSRHESLSAWTERIQRPGFKLLWAEEMPDHSYFAIFDSGEDTLAFCEKENADGLRRSSSMSICDSQDNDVLDTKNRKLAFLSRKYLLGMYTELDGRILPVKPGTVGPIHIKYHEQPSGRTIDVTIPWEK